MKVYKRKRNGVRRKEGRNDDEENGERKRFIWSDEREVEK